MYDCISCLGLLRVVGAERRRSFVPVQFVIIAIVHAISFTANRVFSPRSRAVGSRSASACDSMHIVLGSDQRLACKAYSCFSSSAIEQQKRAIHVNRPNQNIQTMHNARAPTDYRSILFSGITQYTVTFPRTHSSAQRTPTSHVSPCYVLIRVPKDVGRRTVSRVRGSVMVLHRLKIKGNNPAFHFHWSDHDQYIEATAHHM